MFGFSLGPSPRTPWSDWAPWLEAKGFENLNPAGGLLITPLGAQAVLAFGSFIGVSPRAAERPIVGKFVACLREEIREEAQGSTPGSAQRRPAKR